MPEAGALTHRWEGRGVLQTQSVWGPVIHREAKGLQVCDTRPFRVSSFCPKAGKRQARCCPPPPLKPPSRIHKPFPFSLHTPHEGKPDGMKREKRGKEQIPGCETKGLERLGRERGVCPRAPLRRWGLPVASQPAPHSGLACPAESRRSSVMDWTSSSLFPTFTAKSHVRWEGAAAAALVSEAALTQC